MKPIIREKLAALFRGSKPASLPAHLARLRGHFKSMKGQLPASLARALEKPVEKPEWVKQSSVCLHDASRNVMLLKLAVKFALKLDGYKNKKMSYKLISALPGVRDNRLRQLILMVNSYSSLEGEVIALSKKKVLVQSELDRISEIANRMVALVERLKKASSFLGQKLKGTDGEPNYASYLQNIPIVKASLLPLINQSPRKYAERYGVSLQDFFSGYGKKIFIDRTGGRLEPVFNTFQKLEIKANEVGLEGALDNLIRDAINHNPGQEIFVDSFKDDGHVAIRVYNEGPPIPKERLGLIGVDAYWSKGSGQLRGHGKVSVKEFCEDHGGTFRAFNMVRNGRHYGPCLEMRLPLLAQLRK